MKANRTVFALGFYAGRSAMPATTHNHTCGICRREWTDSSPRCRFAYRTICRACFSREASLRASLAASTSAAA